MLWTIFGEEGMQGPYAVGTLLRKLYSIVAFTLIGIVVDRALPPTRRATLYAALVVGAFSAAIEVAQKLGGASEGLLSNGIDVMCGVAGGWLGSRLSQLARRRETSP